MLLASCERLISRFGFRTMLKKSDEADWLCPNRKRQGCDRTNQAVLQQRRRIPPRRSANRTSFQRSQKAQQSRLASRGGYSRLSVRVSASTSRGQQKHPEAPQGTNSSHRLKTRRDKNPASIESTHSQHPFSRRSTCLQGFNR